jgi:hypothetical protein
MIVSTAGLIGAGIGLALALVTYVIMANAWRGRLTSTAIAPDERAKIEQSWTIIRMILLADFVILGAVGYYAGQLLGG